MDLHYLFCARHKTKLFWYIPNPAALEGGCGHVPRLAAFPGLAMGTTQLQAVPISISLKADRSLTHVLNSFKIKSKIISSNTDIAELGLDKGMA